MSLWFGLRKTGADVTVTSRRLGRGLHLRVSFDGRFSGNGSVWPWFGKRVTQPEGAVFVYRWVPFFAVITAKLREPGA